MDHMEHIHGKPCEGDTVLLDDVDGYLGCHARPNGRRSYFGDFEAPTEKVKKLDQNNSYRLVLDDGRCAEIFADIHPATTPGKAVAEFHVTGTFSRN